MKKLHIIIYIALAGCMLSACSAIDEPQAAPGEARFALRSGDDAITVTDDEAISLKVVGEKTGMVLDCKSVKDIPASMTLPGGKYMAYATVGDSVAASFDKRYFKGATEFTVSATAVADVKVDCKIVNSAVKVDYDQTVDDVLYDYTMTVGHTGGELTFTGRDSRQGYFIFPSSDERTLTWTLKGTTDTGAEFEKTGILRDVEPACCYTISITFNGVVDPMGGLPVDIDVDTSVTEINFEDYVAAPPVIEGIGFDINETVSLVAGEIENDLIAGIATVGKLKSLTVSCDKFVDCGMPLNDIDFATATEDDLSGFLKKGIRATIKDTAEGSTAAINFSHFFLGLLPTAETTIVIKAADESGKTSTKTLKVNITEP